MQLPYGQGAQAGELALRGFRGGNSPSKKFGSLPKGRPRRAINMISGSPFGLLADLIRQQRRNKSGGFSAAAAALRAKRNAERGESEPGSERPQREPESEASDFVAAVLLAGARRRGEVPLAPPPPQPTPVVMTAEGIINAGKKRRGEPVGGPK